VSTCWFNDDAYSTDSSSRGSSPRNVSGTTANKVSGRRLATETRRDDSSSEAGDGEAPAATFAASPHASSGQRADSATPEHAGPQTTPEAASPTFSAAELAMASESDAELSLPEAAEGLPDKEGIDNSARATTVAEMSERTMKQWLKRFANDGDAEFLERQWRSWSSGSARLMLQVVAWLLRCGLDDCVLAEPASAALAQLLNRGSLPKSVVEEALAAYSSDDLEDLALDNPKLRDFVASVRTTLATCSTSAEQNQETRVAATPSAKETNGDLPIRYTREELIMVRRACIAHTMDGSFEADALPRWRAEAVEMPPLPLWQQRMAASGSQSRAPDGQSKVPGAGAWREAQRRATELRNRGTGDGKSGRAKEGLQVSESSWVAQTRKWKEDKTVDEAASVDMNFIREIRLTLNKLTLEKFDQLSEQIILLVAKSTRPNRGIPALMQLVFEKATTQHHFINMYVKMCARLHQWLTANSEIMAMESQSNFKRILLNQCQSSFEQYLEPPEGFDGLSGAELYEAQVK